MAEDGGGVCHEGTKQDETNRHVGATADTRRFTPMEDSCPGSARGLAVFDSELHLRPSAFIGGFTFSVS
jgi:hypothetical protein